jgi:hypothetical protein
MSVEVKDSLKSLSDALKSVSKIQDSYMKSLTPDQRILYSKFQSNYAELVKIGDLAGAQKLAEKFKEQFND